MKKIFAAIAALAIAAAFTACGEVEESSSQKYKAPVAAASESEAESAADDSVAVDETEDESGAETPDESEDDSSEPEGIGGMEEDPVIPDFSPAENAEFISPDGETRTFGELRNYGTANYKDGYFYCLVPEGGGAGSSYYSLYYSTDGKNWTISDDFVQVLNGENKFFGMDDGTIVCFSYRTAEAYVLPKAVNFIFDADQKAMTQKEYTSLFDGLFTHTDGTPVTDNSILSFDVGYGGRRTFGCTFIDTMTGETLYDGQITLPEE